MKVAAVLSKRRFECGIIRKEKTVSEISGLPALTAEVNPISVTANSSSLKGAAKKQEETSAKIEISK